MSKQKASESLPTACSEEEVAAYLRHHAEFFATRPDLLAELEIPHASGAAVSLVERQVGILREQNRQLRRKMLHLVEVARDNDQLFERIQQFTLSLLAAHRLTTVLELVQTGLREQFHADAIALRLFVTAPGAGLSQRPEFTDRAAAEQPLGNVLRAARPLCGKPKPSQLLYLFGELGDDIASAALLPLGEAGQLGILAIGSFDPQRFHPEMGKLFLGYLGEALSHTIQRLLEQ